ncbi:AMP-binding protein [Alkalihalobacterium chitinilyticum]|uniref:Acyl-CoA synthetase n=1 Tax=Alkalihalobacterium chitinilyticum TaxID=2980103 RepID=A0ABT5VI45_9BACI|nr:AMP-binding protein [Alkalihalobacterium chitinilyticum]MDE5414930.1 AMP-binding protein [Alkalihalobacterium chitinilyticum]
MSKEKTLPHLLIERGTKMGNQVALRQKELGIWNEISWADYLENVRTLSIGLASELDVKKGDKVAILGDNRPQWLYSQLAAQSLGAIVIGIYQEATGDELIYYLNHCDAKIVVAEDQEQVDKLLEIEELIPNVEKIIYYNDKSLRTYKNEKLLYMRELQKAGETLTQKEPDFFNKKAEQVFGDDVAIISYTSGSTGDPKGVMLTHNNLISAAKSLAEVDPVAEKDDYLSFLPLAWIGEQVMSVTMSLCKGNTINFPEQPTTVLTDLREIGPHSLFAPPRTYENIISRFKLRIDGATWFKRKVYNFFKPFGDKMADAKLKQEPISLPAKIMYGLGDFLVFSAIRDHLGLSRIKRAYNNGAPLGEEAIHFFHSLGVNLKQCYGASEVCGISLVQRDGDLNQSSVGLPLPNTEVKISNENEVLIKSSSQFVGYYKEASDHVSGTDGWVSLGDHGDIDDKGHLHIKDQANSIFTTQNGETIAPSYFENKLKNSRFIKEALVYGKDKPYLVSMINIDMANVGRWAEKNQIVYTTFADLSIKKEVLQLIEKEVASIMKDIKSETRIKKIVIFNKELDADDGELTRTQKIRRGYLEDKYESLLEGLYSSNGQVSLTYNNGNQSDVNTNLEVIDLDTNKEVA